jgi:hypothetical protein
MGCVENEFDDEGPTVVDTVPLPVKVARRADGRPVLVQRDSAVERVLAEASGELRAVAA